jgi:hypothetical protein
MGMGGSGRRRTDHILPCISGGNGNSNGKSNGSSGGGSGGDGNSGGSRNTGTTIN